MSRPTVGFVGLTHLGLVSATATAAKGFPVVGFDPDTDRVRDIARGHPAVREPGLDDLLHEHGSRLRVGTDPGVLSACDVVYIAGDVPTDDRGVSDLGTISSLIDTAIGSLSERAVLIVLCQVPPGFTRGVRYPSSRLYYQVETLVFGRAVERALDPERIIVGSADPDAPLPAAYAAVLEAFGCPILPMRYESAELAKIAINCHLVASVSVANTLAELSERIGADWGQIAPALRLDRRIGAHAYLAPGLGLAGGNLERDLGTVVRLAEASGSEAGVIRAFVRDSRHRRDWVLRALHAEILGKTADAVIGILGLAYKENTHSTKNSPSLALIEHLWPWRLQVYDPVVAATVVDHPRIVGASTALAAAQGADALVIMTPWPAFRELKPSDLASLMAGRTVVDPYGVLDAGAVVAAGLDHLALGRPPRRARRR